MSLRLCGAAFNLSGRSVAVVAGRAVAPSMWAAGLCGIVSRLWARFLPFRCVRWLARVRPTVSVPCLGDVVCFVALCCVVPCFAVVRRAGVCCVAVRSALACRAAPCCAVVCLARVAGCAVLCRAAPCRVLLCCVVGCLVVVRCTAVRCGAVCRVASCCAVYRCAVVCGGPFSLPFRCGVGSALVRLAHLVVRDARRGYVAGWWLGGAVRCGVARWFRAAGVRVCRSGLLVRRVSAGLPSLGSCASVLCPLGVYAPSPGCRGRVLFLFWCLCRCLCGSPCCGGGGRPGNEGVLVGCTAVYSAALPVGVAPSPRVGVPSFSCAGSGGWWA